MELPIVAGAPPRIGPAFVSGRTIVGRVMAALGADVYRIALGSSTVDVRSEVALAAGQELTLVVQADPHGVVLRLSTPAPDSPTPGPAPLPPPPADPGNRAVQTALRAEGLPLERDLLAAALRLLESFPLEQAAAARAAAHLLARGIVPEGLAAEGLADLLAGRPSLPVAADLATAIELARRGTLPEAEPLVGHPVLDPQAPPDPRAIDELPRLLLAAKRALEAAIAKRLAGEPRLAAIDAALERLAKPEALPPPPAARPDPAASDRLERLAARVIQAVEAGDREAALRAIDEELPRLEERERRSLEDRLARREERILERDETVREARAAHREVDGALARLEGARLARMSFQAERDPVVYVGSAPAAGLADGTLHVFRRRGGAAAPDGALSLYVDLRSERLGRVTGWVRLVGRAVAIRFGVEREDVSEVFEAGKPGFLDTLSGLGYAADVGIEVEAEPPPEVGFPAVPQLLARAADPDPAVPGRIDLWI